MQGAYNAVTIDRYNHISSYHDIREQLEHLSTEFRCFLTKPEYLLPFLQPGRLVKVNIYNIFIIFILEIIFFNYIGNCR